MPVSAQVSDVQTSRRPSLCQESWSDDVLAWMIDIPGTGGNGPWGLRGHKSTRPITREFALCHVGDTE